MLTPLPRWPPPCRKAGHDYTDNGAGWNYLGVCPECQMQEQQLPESDAPKPDQQKRSLPEKEPSPVSPRPSPPAAGFKLRHAENTWLASGDGIGTVPVLLLSHSTGGFYGLCNTQAKNRRMARGIPRDAPRHPPPPQDGVSWSRSRRRGEAVQEGICNAMIAYVRLYERGNSIGRSLPPWQSLPPVRFATAARSEEA